MNFQKLQEDSINFYEYLDKKYELELISGIDTGTFVKYLSMSLDDLKQQFGMYLFFVNKCSDALDQVLKIKYIDTSMIQSDDLKIIKNILNNYLMLI